MTATVDGVLEHNKQIRDNMLKHNIGKYSQWPFALKPAIGEYYDIDYNRQLSDLKDGKDLLSFTHDGKSTYSEEIKRKFFSSREEEPYFVRPLTYGELNPWIEFQNGSYIQYIDDVFGKDDVMRHVDYINNLLSGQFIENALRQTEVGVIRDINVAVALQGIVTTNPNNMSGEDTVMGKISNRMYAQTLYNGAIFNSDRMKAKIHDGENYYQKAYLTPELVNQYGNNLANLYELSDIMKIGTNETHIREDLGADVRILDGYDGNVANLDLLQFRILNKQIKKAIELRGVDNSTLTSKIVGDIYGNTSFRDNKGNDVLLPISVYTPINGQGYVNISKKDSDWRYDNIDISNYRFTALQDVENPVTPQEKGARLFGVYAVGVYNEEKSDEINFEDDNNQFNSYNDIPENGRDLLSKTSRLFNRGKLDTMIARFHNDSDKYGKIEFTDTARSKFGNSHGRNLLRLDAVGNPNNDTNGYDNPYCRTWTYHHQYNQVKKLIRPFTRVVSGNETEYKNRDIQAMNKKYRAYRSTNGENAIFGYQSLADNTVLQSNGFVKITPKSGDEGIDVKKCMFSIENLAWKDVLDIEDNLSKEQRGPNGGRIMWFPPYDLDFQEGVNVEWNQNTFIGRGEKVYTYTNTERTGTLSFSLLIDHPAIINSVTKNSYGGMGKEKDPEADILRFFAGCELLQETDKIIEKPNPIPQEKPNSQQKEGKIVFKIYYPNNFTGIISESSDCKTGKIASDEFEDYVLKTEDGTSGTTTSAYNSEFKEDYWWQYILVGNNTCVPVDKQYFRGYEMMPMSESGNGLTNDTTYTNISLPTCKENKYKVHPKIENIEVLDGFRNTCTLGLSTNKNERYYYQVDEDLHQKLNDKGSYKDTTSFQLNASFVKIDEKAKHQDYEYTFAEVIMALLAYNKGKGTYGALYDLYKEYVIDTIKVDNNRVQSLLNIFNDDKIKFTGISYRGSSDNNDKTNSNMLACRRATSGHRMLKRLFGKLNDTSLTVTPGTNVAGGKTNVPAYSEVQKINRFCEFTINYIIPSEELKDTAGDNGVANNGNNSSGSTSGETTGVTFDDYMSAIVKFSPALSAYTSLVMGDYLDYNGPIDNGKLRQAFEAHFNSLNKTNINLDDDTFMKAEVDELMKNVNYDALILTYAVTDDDTNGYFAGIYQDKDCNETLDDFPGHKGYRCIKGANGEPLLPLTDKYDFLMTHVFACFLGGNVKLSDYEPTDSGSVQFTYVVPDSIIIYEDAECKSYRIDMDKLLTEVVLGRYLYDKYDSFTIMSKDDKIRYLVRLCELIYNNDSTTTFDIINGTGLYHDDGIIPQRSTINYQNAYFDLLNSIITDEEDEDGNEIPCVISLLNEEIRDEEEKEKQKEQGQQIKQQRPETQENKAEKQELNEIAMVYGRDENIPNIRYETEGDYFQNIEITDPLLYKNLKDKFKYFNPAYHSISPEGFNARLTFLQQCTRQGQTVEMGSDTNNSKNGYTKTAANLAFGRMPVCVIRIGDFINTKAIINNMTISYAATDGIVWDLNAEGAGVQPMYAKISLGITLLGGQSLGAPISRLQNAISFNYYANAEAYDNRADVATYEKRADGDGYDVSYKRLWAPVNNKADAPKNENNLGWGTQGSNVEEKNGVQNNTFKSPTDEQIAEKLNPETSGSTSGETEFDENMVKYSEELTNYVINYNRVKSVLVEYNADSYIIEMYCNKDCSSYSYNGRGNTGVTSEQVKIFREKLNEAIDEAVHTYKIINNL